MRKPFGDDEGRGREARYEDVGALELRRAAGTLAVATIRREIPSDRPGSLPRGPGLGKGAGIPCLLPGFD
jgi:hypothetical protein